MTVLPGKPYVTTSHVAGHYVPGVVESWLAQRSCDQFNNHTAVFLLLPGLSPALMRRVLGRCAATILNWRRMASSIHAEDPSIGAAVRELSKSMTVADGIWFARNRGTGALSYWSRLAIKTMRAEGMTHGQLAAMFHVHLRTVRNVCSGSFGAGFDPLTGVRRPTAHQCAPPGRWQSGLR